MDDHVDIKKALQIVIDLAKQNVIDIKDDAAEHARQMEAINTVEDMAVNQFGDEE